LSAACPPIHDEPDALGGAPHPISVSGRLTLLATFVIARIVLASANRAVVHDLVIVRRPAG